MLKAIAQYQLLSPDGELAVEHDPHRKFIPIEGLEICREKVYGNTALTFYKNSINPA